MYQSPTAGSDRRNSQSVIFFASDLSALRGIRVLHHPFEPTEYRRMTGSSQNKWHWRTDCHMWPETGFETIRASRRPDPQCARCGQLGRQSSPSTVDIGEQLIGKCLQHLLSTMRQMEECQPYAGGARQYQIRNESGLYLKGIPFGEGPLIRSMLSYLCIEGKIERLGPSRQHRYRLSE